MNQRLDPTIVEPSLSNAEVIGIAATDSPVAGDRIRAYRSAQEAVANADVAELFVLYEREIKDHNQTCQALEQVLKHYVGSKDMPRAQSNENAIAAMERVALAALDLARLIAIPREQEQK